MGIIVIFSHKPGKEVAEVNLEDLKLLFVPYTEPELGDGQVMKRVESFLTTFYRNCVVYDGARTVETTKVASEVMAYAREQGWFFWKDLHSNTLLGTELRTLKGAVSIKLVEEALRVEYDWRFS